MMAKNNARWAAGATFVFRMQDRRLSSAIKKVLHLFIFFLSFVQQKPPKRTTLTNLTVIFRSPHLYR
jgi:hypothetical protein